VKALIVRLSAIGDVVHALPAASALRAHGWEVGWVVEPAARPLLESYPLLTHLTPVPSARHFRIGPAREAVAALRAHGYDVALDFQGLWKSAAWARLSGSRRVIGWSRRWRREPLSAVLGGERVELPPTITHVIDENLALLRPLGIEAVGRRWFALPRPGAEAYGVGSGLAQMGVPGDDFVVLNPGGGWPTKLWSADRFGKLADALWSSYGLRSLVTYGPGEEELADSVRRASQLGKAQPVSLSLKAFYSLAKSARVYVGGDTGPTHIAVAAGTPIVGLFGPTEWWRNGSPRAEDVCVERTDIDCRVDCHRRSCSKWICMDIEVERVLRAVEKRIG